MPDIHVMLDLETWGTKPDSAIRSIGAVAFDRHFIRGTFYRNISDQSCFDLGLTIDRETVEFWDKQPEAARGVFSHRPVDLPAALTDLCAWYTSTGARCVWAHGAAFDIPIIEEAFTAASAVSPDKLSPPWHYRDVRDTRTLFDLAGVKIDFLPFFGIKHYALDDALHQAAAVIRAWSKLDSRLNATI